MKTTELVNRAFCNLNFHNINQQLFIQPENGSESVKLFSFGTGLAFSNMIAESFSRKHLNPTAFQLMKDKVRVFLFLKGQRGKRFVKIGQYLLLFFFVNMLLFQDESIFFKTRVHIVRINYSGVDFHQMRINRERNNVNATPATALEEFLIPMKEYRICLFSEG